MRVGNGLALHSPSISARSMALIRCTPAGRPRNLSIQMIGLGLVIYDRP